MKKIDLICITMLLCMGMNYICACSSAENKNNKAENQQFYISGHILVPININGVNADFMLDNGCSTTYIDSAFFFSSLFDSTFKIIRPNQLERINVLKYNGKLLINIDGKDCEINSFYVRNLKHDGYDERRNGIIGYDLLQDKVLILDFIDYILKLNEDYSDTGYSKVPFIQVQNNKHQKLIEAEVFSSNITNHKKGTFMFDLGCGGSASAVFKHKFIKSLESDIEKIGQGEGHSSIIMRNSLTLWKIDSINFLNFNIKNVPVATLYYTDDYGDPIAHFQGDGLLGCKFFDGFVLIVDFKKNLLFIKK